MGAQGDNAAIYKFLSITDLYVCGCLFYCSSEQKPLTDGVLCRYDEHEDSVYAAEWSAADPWVFASLSYDGRLVINRVPRNTKYQILL